MMALDITDVRSFYASSLGEVTRRLLLAAILDRWEHTHGLVVLGFGYATPYLEPFREKALRAAAFMPAAQGVVNWPATGLSASALVDGDQLPLRDSAVDRIIAVHAIEMAHRPVDVLSELWRVLSPGGKIIVIAPNRTGLWARIDSTPFGHGLPFSRAQLTTLLREALFTPIHWSEALYVPPVRRRMLLKSARTIDTVCARLALPFAGVHVIEATKQVFRPIASRRAARVLVAAPEPVLVPGSGRSG
jgi:SAM-dependent methyltransferase